MKLMDIIKYFDYLCDVQIIQMDSYLETSPNYGEEDEIYTGTVWDIPWWITDMYLDEDDAGGCIGIDKGNNRLVIYVRENQKV